VQQCLEGPSLEMCAAVGNQEVQFRWQQFVT
jgi:hypothetical protein